GKSLQKHSTDMFKNTFQSGFLSILYSIGSKPLQIWDRVVRNGHIKRLTDNDIQSLVLEITGTNVSTTYIECPGEQQVFKTLGIKLPFLVMIIKNLKKYFTFEVQVLDDKNVKRRFRASNYQSTTRVKPFICTMPMRLDDGWNQIQFNLSDFTRRAYGTNYIETLRVQVREITSLELGFVINCVASATTGRTRALSDPQSNLDGSPRDIGAVAFDGVMTGLGFCRMNQGLY
ncbi:hypothetical protein QZH41_017677, partial [Actinostola sp. cb2023]